MKNKNAGFLVRVCAYFVDMFIIAFVASLLSMPFIDNDSVENINKEVTEIVEKATNKEISIKTYTTELIPLIYQSDRANGIYTIFVLILSVAYFVVFQFYTKQTLGKKLFKIKIEANKGELTMNQMVFRGMIINSILFSLISLIFVIFAKSDMYFFAKGTINFIYYIIVIVSVFMIIFRNDRRGLHDVICNTKVVKC